MDLQDHEPKVQVPGHAAPLARRRWRLFLGAAVLACAFMLAAEILRIYVGSNFHVVVPHACYRCGQPTADGLAELLRLTGSRTVLNLRGVNPQETWYQQEKQTAALQWAQLVDIGLSAYAPPSTADFRTLVTTLDSAPEPILIHCHSGSDRTGLAAALYLLLKTDASIDTALGQLNPRYGHNPWGKAAAQRTILDRYAAWLRDQNLSHAPEAFRRWALEVYRE